MSERIVGVAFRYPTGLVCSLLAPKRHGDIIRAVCALGADHATPQGCEQGFLTDAGRFLDRKAAGLLADASGQAHRTPGSYVSGELFSEDLW